MPDEMQERMDRFYFAHGPCCAGCDWWHWINAVTGECRRSAKVSSADRWGALGMTNVSCPPSAGHVITLRDHHCGEFKDGFDWSSLPLSYRKRVGGA